MIRRGLMLNMLLLVLQIVANGQQWRQNMDSADLAFSQRRVQSAMEYYQLVIQTLPTDSVVSAIRIHLYNKLDSLEQMNGNYAGSLARLDTARSIISLIYGESSAMYAWNCLQSGKMNYQLKQFAKAESFYRKAQQIWVRLGLGQGEGYASACNVLGILYNDQGRFEMAISSHLEARSIRELIFTRESGPYAQSCNNLGAIYWNLGDYKNAEPLALQAKEIRGRVRGIRKTDYAISCTNLANIYRDMGKYEQAEELYVEARNVRGELNKENADYASACNILADLYYYTRRYVEAENLYKEAMQIRERLFGADDYSYAQSCNNLANVYIETMEFERAEAVALRARQIWLKFATVARNDLAINCNVLGQIFLQTGRLDSALIYFMQARKVWSGTLGAEHPYYTTNTLNIARVNWKKGDVRKAELYYRQAFASQLGQISRLFEYTSEEEKELYLQNVIVPDNEFQSFFHATENTGGADAYEISLMKKNLILSSNVTMRRKVFRQEDTALKSLFGQWVDLKKQLARLSVLPANGQQEYLRGLTERANIIEKDLSTRVATNSKGNEEKKSWRQVKALLRKDEAAIEFVEFNYFNGDRYTDSIYYKAVILRKDQPVPVALFLFEKRQLDSLFRKSSSDPGAMYTRGVRLRADSSLTRSSYRLIWKPLVPYLKGISRIYFAPAGLLHRVAFSALPVDSATRLCDRYQLIQVSSTAAINHNSDFIDRKNLIALFGGVTYNTDGKENVTRCNDLPYLPGTDKETRSIAATGASAGFKMHSYSGISAREDSVKLFSSSNRLQALHIATHGFFLAKPSDDSTVSLWCNGNVFKQAQNPLMRSGLFFALAGAVWNNAVTPVSGDDGILTAYEVSNMYLPDVRLVVLSACETALGDISGSEGVYGLQRAFRVAGARNLVMSLWKVPDKETSEFMESFYDGLFKGQSIEAAFNSSRILMRHRYPTDPYKWAAWILIR